MPSRLVPLPVAIGGEAVDQMSPVRSPSSGQVIDQLLDAHLHRLCGLASSSIVSAITAAPLHDQR